MFNAVKKPACAGFFTAGPVAYPLRRLLTQLSAIALAASEKNDISCSVVNPDSLNASVKAFTYYSYNRLIKL